MSTMPPSFPTPTPEELVAVEIDLEFLREQSSRAEFDLVTQRLIAANRNMVRSRLADLRFDVLVGDPEVAMLEEKHFQVKAVFLSRIQICFVLEAYMILCEAQGISRHDVMEHAQRHTGPIVQGLWKAIYGQTA